MDHPTRIGYQGILYSNSMEAASAFASQFDFPEPVLIPLVTSQGVVDALRKGLVDCGVVAVCNSVSGPVTETRQALEGLPVIVLAEAPLPIHHCLFCLNRDIGVESISMVAAPVQALDQCRHSVERILPGRRRMEVEDTAIAARYLREGTLPPCAAVLCPRVAGEHFGLHLMADEVEDSNDNLTTFALIRLTDI